MYSVYYYYFDIAILLAAKQKIVSIIGSKTKNKKALPIKLFMYKYLNKVSSSRLRVQVLVSDMNTCPVALTKPVPLTNKNDNAQNNVAKIN